MSSTMTILCRQSLHMNGRRALVWSSSSSYKTSALLSNTHLRSWSSRYLCGISSYSHAAAADARSQYGYRGGSGGGSLRLLSSTPTNVGSATDKVVENDDKTNTLDSDNATCTNNPDVNTPILECVQRHDPAQAHQLLLRHHHHIESLSTHANNALHVDTYTAVLDAWLVHQDDVILHMNDDVSLVAELRRAAEHSNDILDWMMQAPSTSTAAAANSRNNSSSDTSKNQLYDDDDKSESDSKIFSVVVEPSTHHFDAVLKAWCRVCQQHAMPTNKDATTDMSTTSTIQEERKSRGGAAVTSGRQRLRLLTKGVPQRAQRVLSQMETTASGGSIRPSIASYNYVMEAWARSGEHLRGSMAQSIYKKIGGIGGGSPTVVTTNNNPGVAATVAVTPNANTQRIMMYAWSHSGQKRAAFNATGHLMQLQEGWKKHADKNNYSNNNNKDDNTNSIKPEMDMDNDMEPTIEDYHMVLEAWTRAEGKLGHRRAVNILKLMDDTHLKRLSEVRPNETCFRYVLVTLARTPLPDMGVMADKLLDQMDDRLMIPDTECYGAAIRAWKNSAVAPDRTRPHEDAKRANELLKQMQTAYLRTSAIVIKPSAEHYTDVIHAWSVCHFASLTVTAAEMTEKLLAAMEESYSRAGNDTSKGGDLAMKPSIDTYMWVIKALANSILPDKVDRALVVFEKMKASAAQSSSYKPAPITAEAVNAMMTVCTNVIEGDEATKKAAFRTAFGTLSELQTQGQQQERLPGPNCASYRILLEACVNLLPSGKERTRALQSVFKNCCLAGLVDVEVLEYFKKSAPSDLYSKLVVAVGVDEGESGKMVPEEWTRNLKYRILTPHGRKPRPLNIEGAYVMTPAIHDNKMRKLRMRKNQRLLRAGRSR